MALSRKDLEKKWAQVLAKAWADERFKEKLLKNPGQALKEMGIEVPTGRRIEVHEVSDKVVHFILPKKPPGEITEEELKHVSAGESNCNWM